MPTIPRSVRATSATLDSAAVANVSAMTDLIKLSRALKLSGLPISIRTATREFAEGRVPGAITGGVDSYSGTGGIVRNLIVIHLSVGA